MSNVSQACIFSVRNCQIKTAIYLVVFIFREDPQSRLAKPIVTSSPYKTPEVLLPAQEERAEPQEEEPPRRNSCDELDELWFDTLWQRIGNTRQLPNESIIGFAD